MPMHDALSDRIRPVMRKLQSRRFWRLLACFFAITALLGSALLAWPELAAVVGSQVAIGLAVLASVLAVVAFAISALSFRNSRWVAAKIEDRFPALKQRLLTALSSDASPSSGYLQMRVIREARDHSRTHRWTDVVSGGEMLLSRLSGLAATAFLAVILVLLAISEQGRQRELAASSTTKPSVVVLPGDTEIERGTSLVITARFDGLRSDRVPDEAELICLQQDGSERRIRMTQNLEDPVLGGFVASVDQAFRYRISTDGWSSKEYGVDVFEYPALVRSDAVLNYPDYTQMSPKRVEDTVRIAAVEGTRVTWVCYLNKAVDSARLVSKQGAVRELVADAELPGAYSVSFDLRETERMTLELTDAQQRTNKYPPELIARALPNQPPKLKVVDARDVSVSPLEELVLAMQARDDFGIVSAGLTYSFAMQPEQEIVLASGIEKGVQEELEHLVEFESLDAEPDQLFAYHVWADDYGPDGQLRRTRSDMYFAEVRPFEEIFREGQPPPGGGQQQQQSQNGQRAQELAELQKEIINATWTVIRSESSGEPSDEFSNNTALLRDSQRDAIEQLNELAEQIRDDRSLTIVESVRTNMQRAFDEFTQASDTNRVDPLDPAMLAARAAYGGLLKLRAREFEITRQRQQNQSQSSSSSAQQRQRQIDELELDQEENRYETQQQAQDTSEESQQQREIRQVLSRLRELARRQEDLNKEIARLQSALEQAETEKQREEIERQLKRLREQQQDLLRETDELAERMQQPENAEQMSEASEQLEQTRENVRKASDALEQQNVSEALSAGKRAEREFEEMRDEFRRQAAGEFNDAVRDMRDRAQQLDQQQEELSEQLRQVDQQDPAEGLRGPDRREQIGQQIQQQREQLDQLLQQMQQVVEEAEAAEPLLAEKLYDSYRRTQQRQVDPRLQETSELLRRGYDEQAQQSEAIAGEGIDKLREELEEAATSVLGDDTAALQRALSELEQLERSLEQELQENDPNREQAAAGSADRSDSGQQEDSQQASENRSEQSGQPSESQDGQRSSQQGQPSSQQGQQASQEGQRESQRVRQPSEDGRQGSQDGRQRSDDEQQSSQSQQGQPTDQQSDSERQGQPNSSSPSQQGQQLGQQSSSDPSQQQGEQGQNQSSQSQSPSGQRQADGQRSRSQPGSPDGNENRQRIGLDRFAAEGPSGTPLTGDGFRDWSDRLRDVEEMVDDPELRSRAARIRDRAREVRIDFKRHSKPPQWALVEEMIAQPLRELRRDVAEELLRRSADRHAQVPIDRDPVPGEYTDAVRRYYESLGSGR